MFAGISLLINCLHKEPSSDFPIGWMTAVHGKSHASMCFRGVERGAPAYVFNQLPEEEERKGKKAERRRAFHTRSGVPASSGWSRIEP